ncbi:MAG TPA: sigma 54-interacting transcriptional regulator [candidate division Zixibacteria bacterium]|nr:sigma 54-interacting transcriptional regulator [candidate division Zixibacteria bacterium]
MAVSCAPVPENLLEGELLGHVRGAHRRLATPRRTARSYAAAG